MTEVAYFLLIQANLLTYLCILIAVFVLYYLLLAGKIVSLFDPLLISFTASAMGFSTVVLLYITRTIDVRYLLSYLATEAAFLGGFLRAYSPTSLSGRSGVLALIPRASASTALFIALPTYLCTSAFSYAKFGIPLFDDVTRLESYYQSDIWSSLLNKIYGPTGVIVATLALCCFQSRSLFVRISAKTGLVLVTCNVLLSGSKGALLVVVGVMYYSKIYFDSSRIPFPRGLGRLISAHPFFLMTAILTIFVSVSWVRYDAGPLAILVARIAGSGDIYYLAYPNHVLDSMPSSGVLPALFPGLETAMGIHEKALPLGAQVFEFVMGYSRLEAPNARHNVFALVHLGYIFSVVYSGILGYLLGFARFKLLLYSKQRLAGLIYFVGIAFALSGIEADSGYAISNVLGTIFCGTIYLFLAAGIERAFQFKTA